MSKVMVYRCELLDDDLAPVISTWYAKRERIEWRAKSCCFEALIKQRSSDEPQEPYSLDFIRTRVPPIHTGDPDSSASPQAESCAHRADAINQFYRRLLSRKLIVDTGLQTEWYGE
jgi:hypothetical protein